MSSGAPARFYVSCVGGLEEVAAQEILEATSKPCHRPPIAVRGPLLPDRKRPQEHAPAADITDVEFGRVHFTYAGPVAALLGLRTIEHVHAYVAVLGPVRPERAWLGAL